MKQIFFNDIIKHKYLNEYIATQPKGQLSMFIGRILRALNPIVACGIAVYCVVNSAQTNNQQLDLIDWIVGFILGTVCGTVVGLLGSYICKKTFKEFGSPFVERQDEVVELDDDVFRHQFYHESDDGKFVGIITYTIFYKDIVGLDLDENTQVLTINGNAEIKTLNQAVPADMEYDLDVSKLCADGTGFKILMATSNAKAIVEEIRKKMQAARASKEE